MKFRCRPKAFSAMRRFEILSLLRQHYKCANTSVYSTVDSRRWNTKGAKVGTVPFILELVSQIEDFDLNFAQSVMIQDVFVGLPLPVFHVIVVFRVRGEVISWLEVGKVSLDVAGGA